MQSIPSADERFRTIYEQNYADVRDYCIRRLGIDDAADAAVEVFTVAWRRIDEMPRGREARLWLFGVARNVVAHQHRSREHRRRIRAKLETNQGDVGDRRPVESEVLQSSRREAVINALERLKPEAREVVRLRMWEGLSHAEVGEVLGISAHAAEMRLHRAAKRLARLLDRTPAYSLLASVEGGEL